MLTRRLSPAWWTNAGLVLLGLALMLLCRQGVNEIHHFVIGFGLVDMYQASLRAAHADPAPVP
jgi:hypothetical protein